MKLFKCFKPGIAPVFPYDGGVKTEGALSSKKEKEPPKNESAADSIKNGGASIYNTSSPTFSYQDLVVATDNFGDKNCFGVGGSGPVYEGHLRSIGQFVVVKQLDQSKSHGAEEFVAEVQALSLLDHPNIAKIIGCCADGGHRLLVSEYMPLVGSLDDLLHDLNKYPLDWNTRIKIAIGAAKGLEHLHCKANPPIIHGDLKTSNILLGEGFHPKLSDFALARLAPTDESPVTTTNSNSAYLAPEYAMTGCASLKSDIYSFGVVLLEIMTGRRPINGNRAISAKRIPLQTAREILNVGKHVTMMADVRLEGRFPELGLSRALAVASLCFQEKIDERLGIGDVASVLSFIALQSYDPNASPRPRIDSYNKDEFGNFIEDLEQGTSKAEPPRKEETVEEAKEPPMKEETVEEAEEPPRKEEKSGGNYGFELKTGGKGCRMCEF